MISATNVSQAYGAQTVLDRVSFTLDRTTRAGLVGANGSGKTTLLRILAGQERPESGDVGRSRGLLLSFLPQRFELPIDMSVYEAAESGYHREFELLRQREEIADRLKAQEGGSESLLGDLARLDHDLEESGFYLREPAIAKVLKGLGFSQADHRRPLREFSGGWRMRAALAKALLSHPDILLLDEPTNYLDTEARLWLSEFLRTFSGGVLIVSHDRAFLDDTVTEILELFLGRVRRYKGGYSDYERQREAELAQLLAAWENQQKEIAKQEDFIRRFRAKATKAKQVQSRIRMLEKEERIEIPEHLRPITIKLPPATHSGRIVLEAQELTKRYGSLGGPAVLDQLSFTLQRGSRLAVLGRNGAGKSTLLRILGGADAVTAGAVTLGRDVEVAYFGQETPDTLPNEMTVLDYAGSRASIAAQPIVRDVLGAFLFGGDSVDKPLSVLSGGERSRLAMAALLLRPANLLILDEPTNHLDITSQEVLARALRHYDGSVVFVSHDRFFIREVATEVLALWPAGQRAAAGVPPAGWQLYPGSYREFEKSGTGRVFEDAADPERRRAIKGAPSPGASGAPRTPARGPAPKQAPAGDSESFSAQKARKSELRKLKKREEELLVRIEELEADHDRLVADLAKEEVYRDPDTLKATKQAIADNEAAQSKAHERWESVTESLAALENS